MTRTEKLEAKKKAKNERRKRQRAEQKANGGKSKWTEEERKKNVWLDHWKFKPGQSGNPSGKRPPQPVTERYKEDIELPCPETIRIELGLPPGARIADAIARRRVIDAITASAKDSNAAAQEIRESIEGKSVTRVSGPMGEGLFPPTLQVTFVPKRKEG